MRAVKSTMNDEESISLLDVIAGADTVYLLDFLVDYSVIDH
jgi:hypothetical protein